MNSRRLMSDWCLTVRSDHRQPEGRSAQPATTRPASRACTINSLKRLIRRRKPYPPAGTCRGFPRVAGSILFALAGCLSVHRSRRALGFKSCGAPPRTFVGRKLEPLRRGRGSVRGFSFDLRLARLTAPSNLRRVFRQRAVAVIGAPAVMGVARSHASAGPLDPPVLEIAIREKRPTPSRFRPSSGASSLPCGIPRSPQR
jgi:hypothetical protein